MAAPANACLPRFLDRKAYSLVCTRLGLSPREAEIVACVVRQEKEVAAARRLKMSPHTLRTHVMRLYQKLGVSSRTGLVVRMYEAFLDLVCEAGSPLEPLCARRAAGGCPFGR